MLIRHPSLVMPLIPPFIFYWNDDTGQVFGMHIVQSRKYERAAADLILTRTVLGGQLVVFGKGKHEEEDQLYNV